MSAMPVPADTHLAAVRFESLRILHMYGNEWANRYWDIGRRAMNLPSGPRPLVMRGQAAADVLTRAHDAIVAESRQLADRLPSHDWLIYLRKVHPDVMGQDTLEGTRAQEERRRGVEALSSLSEGIAEGEPLTIVPPLVVRFAMCARGAVNAHVVRRKVAMGAAVTFDADGWPSPVPDDPFTEAVRVYDDRSGASPGLGVLTGTAVHDGDVKRMHPLATMPFPSARRKQKPGTAGDSSADLFGTRVEDWRFTLIKEVIGIPTAIADLKWFDDSLPNALLLHLALMDAIATSPEARISFMRYGFMRVSYSEFRNTLETATALVLGDVVRQFLPAASADAFDIDEVLQQAQTHPSSTPDVAAPTVRLGSNDSCLLDVAASGWRLVLALRPNIEPGVITDKRGRDFERVIQAEIDTSSWAPPPGLRSLVGKSLRDRDGNVVTDIDAIAVRDSLGILIDAKSYARPGAHEGRYEQVRNIRTDLGAAVAAWRANIDYLLANPRGANYDLSSLDRVVPLVVTVAPHFVHPDLLEPRVFGALRPVASLSELITFLKHE